MTKRKKKTNKLNETAVKNENKHKRLTIHMNEEREKRIKLAQEKFGKKTISGLFDYFLEIALLDPKRFDVLKTEKSDREIQLREMATLLEQKQNQEYNEILKRFNRIEQYLRKGNKEGKPFFDFEGEDF